MNIMFSKLRLNGIIFSEVRMTTKNKPATRKIALSSEAIIQRRIKETKAMIEINQSIKGISWDETDIPTLTNMATQEDIAQKEDSAEISFELLEDFLPNNLTANGHLANCTCIKCSPKIKKLYKD
jgi:hypothetical protein